MKWNALVTVVIALGSISCASSDDDLGAVHSALVVGHIPNADHPASELNKRISPVMSNKHHNQPTVVNGYLLLAGNAIHEYWDIANPYAPVKLSEMPSPYSAGEAESHQVSHARFADGSLHFTTMSGKGIDLWNITDPSHPVLESALVLEGINYGDFTAAVWGVYWQGNYIYVGGTNTGLHIVDATNPSAPVVVKRIPNSAFGNISAGPVYAIGNLLVITTPKESSGIATMDISDPANPVLLDVVDPPDNSYIGGFFGKNIHLQTPFRSYDVTTDPTHITQVGSSSTVNSEYMSFGDGSTLFLGSLRTSAGGVSGIVKYDMSNLNGLVELARIPGRPDPDNDDQFSIPIGNLLVVSDEEKLFGSYLTVHATAHDVTPPQVILVNPRNAAIDQALTTRVGLTFTDQIEVASATASTFIVRPVGGTAITGRWGHEQTTLNFWPAQPLLPGTTYEVVLPAGGVTDLVGNPIAAQFRSTFTTGSGAPTPGCGIAPTSPTRVGQSVSLQASSPDTTRYSYKWSFGDGASASGTSVTHAYAQPQRYAVTLTATPLGGAGATFGAENGTLSGGVVVASNHAGYLGSGFADYPAGTGAGVKIAWQTAVTTAGTYNLDFRYANGGTGARPLRVHVNGAPVQTLGFAATGAWTSWQTQRAANVSLPAGTVTIELVADAGSAGPNLDEMTIPGLGQPLTCSTTQIIHRPLTTSMPTRSSSLIVDAAGGRLWTVNPDANTVSAVALGSLSKSLEVGVGNAPRTLARAPDGSIWVVNQGSDSISVLAGANGALLKTIALPYGSQPYGLAFTPDGGRAFVTLQALGRLVRLDPAARALTGSVELGPDANGLVPAVRGVAVSADSRRVLVTRFVSPDDGGEVFEVDALTLARTRTFALANSAAPDTPDSGRGIPNYLSSISISPDGVKAWLPSTQDNLSRGAARDGKALTHDSTTRPILSRLDLSMNTEELASRVDMNDTELPFAAEVSRYGDLVFVALQGENSIRVLDAYTGQIVSGFATGRAPQGLVLDPGGRLYVQNFMSRDVSIFDVRTILSGTDNTATLLATVGTVAIELLAPNVLRGKQIFYNAADRRMSKEGYISCAGCHLDGGSDGRTWDFTDRGEGLRNTITMQGRAGMGQGPVHFTGNFDEIQDFENDIRKGFGGLGFLTDAQFTTGTRSDPLGDPKAGLSADLDALAAYVASLTEVPRSPYRNADGTLTSAAAAGKAIFLTLDCTSCHSGARLTDSQLALFHDVGTIKPTSGKRRGQPLTGLDTPTLLGAWATAPYFHDGSARTLYDVINVAAHGNASTLPQADKDKVVAYLLQLDQGEIDQPPPFDQTFGAENAALSGGVTVATDHAGYLGTGFADYPGNIGPTVKVSWQLSVPGAGPYNLAFRYACMCSAGRPLALRVNGATVLELPFVDTGAWTTWNLSTVTGISLDAGHNTIEMVADTGVGPNLDQMRVHSP